ncbi:unnamed protein product [Amoebophrya sp. A120]|nr:unnamed protein product [Amoebophrya sp. A120]|eukprot:GSA120T00010243001.1
MESHISAPHLSHNNMAIQKFFLRAGAAVFFVFVPDRAYAAWRPKPSSWNAASASGSTSARVAPWQAEGGVDADSKSAAMRWKKKASTEGGDVPRENLNHQDASKVTAHVSTSAGTTSSPAALLPGTRSSRYTKQLPRWKVRSSPAQEQEDRVTGSASQDQRDETEPAPLPAYTDVGEGGLNTDIPPPVPFARSLQRHSAEESEEAGGTGLFTEEASKTKNDRHYTASRPPLVLPSRSGRWVPKLLAPAHCDRDDPGAEKISNCQELSSAIPGGQSTVSASAGQRQHVERQSQDADAAATTASSNEDLPRPQGGANSKSEEDSRASFDDVIDESPSASADAEEDFGDFLALQRTASVSSSTKTSTGARSAAEISSECSGTASATADDRGGRIIPGAAGSQQEQAKMNKIRSPPPNKNLVVVRHLPDADVEPTAELEPLLLYHRHGKRENEKDRYDNFHLHQTYKRHKSRSCTNTGTTTGCSSSSAVTGPTGGGGDHPQDAWLIPVSYVKIDDLLFSQEHARTVFRSSSSTSSSTTSCKDEHRKKTDGKGVKPGSSRASEEQDEEGRPCHNVKQHFDVFQTAQEVFEKFAQNFMENRLDTMTEQHAPAGGRTAVHPSKSPSLVTRWKHFLPIFFDSEPEDGEGRTPDSEKTISKWGHRVSIPPIHAAPLYDGDLEKKWYAHNADAERNPRIRVPWVNPSFYKADEQQQRGIFKGTTIPPARSAQKFVVFSGNRRLSVFQAVQQQIEHWLQQERGASGGGGGPGWSYKKAKRFVAELRVPVYVFSEPWMLTLHEMFVKNSPRFDNQSGGRLIKLPAETVVTPALDMCALNPFFAHQCSLSAQAEAFQEHNFRGDYSSQRVDEGRSFEGGDVRPDPAVAEKRTKGAGEINDKKYNKPRPGAQFCSQGGFMGPPVFLPPSFVQYEKVVHGMSQAHSTRGLAGLIRNYLSMRYQLGLPLCMVASDDKRSGFLPEGKDCGAPDHLHGSCSYEEVQAFDGDEWGGQAVADEDWSYVEEDPLLELGRTNHHDPFTCSGTSAGVIRARLEIKADDAATGVSSKKSAAAPPALKKGSLLKKNANEKTDGKDFGTTFGDHESAAPLPVGRVEVFDASDKSLSSKLRADAPEFVVDQFVYDAGKSEESVNHTQYEDEKEVKKKEMSAAAPEFVPAGSAKTDDSSGEHAGTEDDENSRKSFVEKKALLQDVAEGVAQTANLSPKSKRARKNKFSGEKGETKVGAAAAPFKASSSRPQNSSTRSGATSSSHDRSKGGANRPTVGKSRKGCMIRPEAAGTVQSGMRYDLQPVLPFVPWGAFPMEDFWATSGDYWADGVLANDPVQSAGGFY